ncbi:hypothetical protein ZIOFF_070811 [Zingiber officinale]|uniref:dUTP diphosphatase n=1 Tax=Zingiber officinale TaxID=94328 RepID=A0A8J5EQ47_ZINOF|nr:hypothetical protein ZIOFF_070811 [Zingiber officinale]
MKIAVPEIEFLGAIIGRCKIKLQPHVITKIADFNDNELKTTKGMRSWLGLLNYARNYIPNLGKLLGPLYAKTSPNGERKLNQQDWDLIHQLKAKVRQLPDLEIPPPECYIILEVDGCMDGWGGICKWKKKKFDPISSEKICAYASGKQYEGTMALVVFRDNRWQGDQAILATMEVDLTRGSQMIYVIPEVMMTIGDFYRNIQISILTRGYEAWQNSEANLLITIGMVGRLSNTPNVGFAYEVQGVVDYLTSHGVNALPGRRLSTRSLQGLNWVINPTQISIPMQPVEVNSQTMMDGRILLSFNNYTAATTPEQPKYNDKDEEILAVWIETKPGVHVYYDGEAENYYEEQKLKNKTGRWDTLGQPSGKFDYYVNYDIPEIPSFPEIPPTGWDDEVDETNNSQKEESIAASERYSSTTEPHILINKISPNAVTPSRQSEESAGLDISASHAAVIEPNGRDLIHTGLRIEIPYGYYGRLASRSGLAWKTGIEVRAGVIDSDYRGEVQVLLFNRTNLPIYISPQQKIAQLILEKIAIPEVYEIPHLSHTKRGNKGFGSTEAQNQITPTLEKNPTSQGPQYFTPQDIFNLLMPKETTAVLVQDDSFQSNFEQDHAVDTSPGAAVPRSMDPTLNYQDLDDSYLDYIQYLSTLSGQQPPQWDSSSHSDNDWTNPFASEGGGRQENGIKAMGFSLDMKLELRLWDLALI